ncbi:hypothetical protein BDN72DRAFT_469587 [Pluteus cervinus]|uniref:Uncharacterized protein n=1 Tax=Pluteus cervinus TaxID=181527 RepID=A0ACD3B0I6_9AGAR|nr:hypothetical protein BDN72DRAFT_469587 [Pluteus cervinus]
MTDESLIIQSGVASLTFMVYDHLLTLDDEVDTIWSKPNKSWLKWTFIGTRYSCLAIQMIKCVLDVFIVARADIDISAFLLREWVMCQVVLNMILLTAVEVVLMLRVYALYDKSKRIAVSFICILLARAASTVTGVLLNLPPHNIRLCEVLEVIPASFFYFGCATIASQLVILILTFSKYYTSAHLSQSRAPIVSLLIRDGTIAFFTLFVVCSATAVMTVLHSPVAPVTDFWLLAAISSSGCRVIINMQRLSVEEYTQTTVFPLTTLCTDYDPQSESYEIDD